VTLQNPPLFSLHSAMNEILVASKRGKLMIQASFFLQVSRNTLKNMVQLLGK